MGWVGFERANRLHNGEDSGGGPGSQRRNSRDIIVGDLWDQMMATMLLIMMLLMGFCPS